MTILQSVAVGSQKMAVPSEARRAKDGGEGGIRTPGALRLSGFQDRRDRPLCHLSFRTGDKFCEKLRLSSFLNEGKISS